MPESYKIGEWTFSPKNNELSREDRRLHLEHRVSRALELLCAKRGDTVTHAEILAHLWGERQVSPNSVAVVMRDLRQALGDDARNPVYLETVAKSGYRLMADAAPAAAPQHGAKMVWQRRHTAAASVLTGAALLLVLAGASALSHDPSKAPATLVLVDHMQNATGTDRYDALARASGEHVITSLDRHPGLQLLRLDPSGARESGTARPPAGSAVLLRSKLVLWSGEPDVVFVAEDRQTSRVIWSGFAFGPENKLPGLMDAKLAEFAGAVSPAAKP